MARLGKPGLTDGVDNHLRSISLSVNAIVDCGLLKPDKRYRGFVINLLRSTGLLGLKQDSSSTASRSGFVPPV